MKIYIVIQNETEFNDEGYDIRNVGEAVKVFDTYQKAQDYSDLLAGRIYRDIKSNISYDSRAVPLTKVIEMEIE